MKRTIMILSLAVLIALGGFSLAAELPNPYPFKSAIVTYKIGGPLQKGTEKLYINDYGRKTRVERNTTMTIMGVNEKESTLQIDDGTYRYSIDLEEKTGTKLPSASKTAREMFEKMSPEQREAMETLGKELVKGFTGKEEMKPIGKGNVLGKECEIYDIMGVKTWQWKNLVLKMDSEGLIDQEATELKVDCPIPSDTFMPPIGVKITEAPLPKEPMGRDKIPSSP